MVRDMKRVKISDNVLNIELINMFDRMRIVAIVDDDGFNKALRFFH